MTKVLSTGFLKEFFVTQFVDSRGKNEFFPQKPVRSNGGRGYKQ
jgi:hypothetical protein